MTATAVNPRMRAVLDAPRGRRFSRPAGAPPPTREQRLLAQMEGNPRVAYRREHGVLPGWMLVAGTKQRNQAAIALVRESTPTPRGRGRHRSRRRWLGKGLLRVASYTTAIVGGTMLGHAVTTLLM
ncbi:hypothetical protein [Nocardiopsis sp. FIRDI 009]|uniref:hypothetical protein n=1 Tax=Nocardiopsis sp. FIRDI 009 TaxID=714197 RepID=UPI0013005019|nr:hypothetical protein [Nocardiopsis sp. FIRDI 009]